MTDNEGKIFTAILNYIRINKIAPTQKELAIQTDLSEKTVWNAIQSLYKKGKIRKHGIFYVPK